MSTSASSRATRPVSGRLALLLLLCVVAVGGTVLQWRRVVPAPVPMEVDRSQLELVAGRLCLRGTTNSFNGHLLERYPGGSLQSRSVVLGGRLHGLSEGWDTNGVLQVREIFAQGVSDGLRTKWHPNGVKLSETPVVAGKVEGVFRRWDTEGHLTEEVEMRQGQPEGVSRAYYPSGHVRLEATLRQGQVVSQTTWKDGEHPAPGEKALAN